MIPLLLRRGRYLAASILLTAGTFASGCDEWLALSDARTLVGETLPLGSGAARSWAEVDGQGRPTALGLTLAEAALAALRPDSTLALRLALPEIARPFDHIELLWRPAGHEPAGVYDVPRVDVQFYLLPAAERETLTDSAVAAQMPALEHVPASYIPVPGLLQKAGNRWVDVSAAEFAGAPFTHALRYGFYGGRLVFVEPSITRAFLESRPDEVRTIKLPQRYAEAGYYPTRYRVRYDAAAREYSITLEGLVRRP